MNRSIPALTLGALLSLAVSSHAAIVVDWGGDYVTANQALAGGAGTTANGDFNADSIALDQRRWVAYSTSTARSPASGYTAPLGKSSTFYGGTMIERYGSASQVSVDPFVNTSVAVLQNASGDRIRTAVRDGSERGFSVVLFNKVDFLAGTPATDTYTFDANTKLSVNIASISNSNLRFVVQDNGNTYVSSTFTTSQTNVAPSSLSWFSWTFDPANTAAGAGSLKIVSPLAASPTFTNISALGYIMSATNSNNFAEVSAFTVDASIASSGTPNFIFTDTSAVTLNVLKGSAGISNSKSLQNNGTAAGDASLNNTNANLSVSGNLINIASPAGTSAQTLSATSTAAYDLDTGTLTVTPNSGGSNVINTTVNVGNATVGGPALTAAVSASGSLAGLASRTTQGESAALGNEAEIAAGTNSAGTDNVSMQWRLRTAPETYPNDPPVLSDVVNLTGITPGDLFVLKIYYKASDIPVAINESTLALGWNDIGVDGWENAVLGNSDGGLSAQRLNGAWTVIGTLDPTDLGKYGVDTTDVTYNGISYGGYVWAVLDHNSEFAVIPEPASLALLALGTLALATKRRRPSNP